MQAFYDAYSVNRSEKQLNVCYASKPNSFVIRADGKINKCTVALSDNVNSIGLLLSDGTISIEPELAKQWSLGFFNNDSDYLACPYSKIKVLQ